MAEICHVTRCVRYVRCVKLETGLEWSREDFVQNVEVTWGDQLAEAPDRVMEWKRVGVMPGIVEKLRNKYNEEH